MNKLRKPSTLQALILLECIYEHGVDTGLEALELYENGVKLGYAIKKARISQTYKKLSKAADTVLGIHRIKNEPGEELTIYTAKFNKK